MSNQDILQNIGTLAVGSRLRRLSDRLFASVQVIYNKHEVPFNSRFFPILVTLINKDGQGIVEIAESLQVTHALVSVSVKDMLRENLLTIEKVNNDARKRIVYLSKKGRSVVSSLQEIWQQLSETLDRLLATEAPQLLTNLDNLELALTKTSLENRFYNSTETEDLQIIKWQNDYKAAFRDLNLEWIISQFEIESTDKIMLENPKKEIINKGGMIFFAKMDGVIAGTCAVIPNNQGSSFELTKMAVCKTFQRHGIGGKLLDTAISYVKTHGANHIWLETNSKLVEAIKLYRSRGFQFIENNKSKYKRVDIAMEKILL